jgi:ATP-dependent Lon protease
LKKSGRRGKLMDNTIDNSKIKVMPLLPLRGLSIFPHMVLHFDVGREKSILSLEQAMVNEQLIFLVSQKDAKIDNPALDDIYTVGAVSKIKQILKLPGDTIRVLVEGTSRAKIVNLVQDEPYFEVEVEEVEDSTEKDIETEALMRKLLDAFEDYVKLSSQISPEVVATVSEIEEPGSLAFSIFFLYWSISACMPSLSPSSSWIALSCSRR